MYQEFFSQLFPGEELNPDDMEVDRRKLSMGKAAFGEVQEKLGEIAKEKSAQSVHISLPALDETLRLIGVACEGTVLFKFYNEVNLVKITRDFYNTTEEADSGYGRKLALIYSFLSVGALLEGDDNAYNYFNAAYTLVRRTFVETNHVMDLKTLMGLVFFLQCTAKLLTCYSFIGVAFRAALRMGLHRKVPNENMMDQENRRRLFWCIYKMDVYMSTILGVPSISDDEIDQEFPTEIEDENITERTYLLDVTNNLSPIAIANHHTKLMIILRHIVKHVYPINTDSFYQKHQGESILTSLISSVKLMEQELQTWVELVPFEVSPFTQSIPKKYFLANRLLRLAYLHIQLALYRPFIHLTSYKYRQLGNINKDTTQYGMHCINVAIQIVELAAEMHQHKLLNGNYWFGVYSVFYSVSCLIYYVHENSSAGSKYDVEQVNRYATKGKDVLVDLKTSSSAAQRAYQTLNVMFERLNQRTKAFHVGHEKYFENPEDELIVSNPNAPFQLGLTDSEVLNPTRPVQDQKYEGSLIDKLDVNLFGRYLPPYMLDNLSNPPANPDAVFLHTTELDSPGFTKPSNRQYGELSDKDLDALLSNVFTEIDDEKQEVPPTSS